ncbi:ATP-binding protein [Novosphingobium sp.]|uniref:ATP-binding protein n=1 Tax=Novosphingobium sp. TaxID=1874826 RepID=UPI001EC7749E|nr:ATP-binding protein [Novosphingobium sp.]MBK6802771.1 ATP-binding protein [Novosphingobium sp.]MBK9012381.1 ATP-binding protein [Novosphingobium sp.]
MDPRRNPFAPGAGTPPPELAGRDALRERVAVALDRIRAGRAAQSVILYGLRGVGKTVLLTAMRRDAEQAGLTVISIEAPEGRSLPAVLAPALRSALLRLDRLKGAGDKVRRALSALAGFVKLKASYGDLAIAVEHEAEPGLADSGDLEADLTDLVRALGEAAAERGTAAVLFIDELQYVPEEQLAALIVALHSASQNQLPVTLVGAGLPQLLGQMGRAKSYAERLFAFESIGPLDFAAAEAALRNPIEGEGERIDQEAIAAIFAATEGYAYFLQEWGKQSWDAAEESPITAEDVALAQASAIAQLDQSFFRVRLDRLSPAEKRYVRAMASLGPGPQRSGEIAQAMDVKVTTVAPIRSSLIGKGMVYSPGHGDTAFTVPMFDAYIRRTMN